MNKKQQKNYLIIGVVVVVFFVALILIFNNGGSSSNSQSNVIKIGVITDLTGPASYWGESTRIGAELAKQDLGKEGYKIELLFEDYQLDARKALNSAQKLVNINQVNAIYAEFNPAAISVGSFVKGKRLLYVYDAAVTSPLKGNELAYKTYLDYQEGCKEIALKFKKEGIERMGVLKVNLEFGVLCLKGVKEIYGNKTYVEAYNLGDQDFKTQLLKLKQDGVRAVINVGFEGDTLNTLKIIKEQGLKMKYGTVDDTITKKVIKLYNNELIGSWTFGFKKISPQFSQRISKYNLSTEYAAAIAYTHIMQIGKAFADCNKNLDCVKQKMNNYGENPIIGFKKFNNRIADLEMKIKGR